MMFLDQVFCAILLKLLGVICDPNFAEAECRWVAQVLHFAEFEGILHHIHSFTNVLNMYEYVLIVMILNVINIYILSIYLYININTYGVLYGPLFGFIAAGPCST